MRLRLQPKHRPQHQLRPLPRHRRERNSAPEVSNLKEGWNSVEKEEREQFQYGVLDENNKVVAATGPIEIDGVDYAFDENGYMLTGEVELTDEDGKTGIYYLRQKGKILQR